MISYRTHIHGHLIEVRRGTFGGEYVLVDGRPVSSKPFAAMLGTTHHFDVTDEAGATRHIEVRLDRSAAIRLRLEPDFVILVDGRERVRVEAGGKTTKLGDMCSNCGYELTGLPVENGEIRCPECGRHSPAPPQG